MDLTTLTKKELTDKCKELSIKGYSNKNKNELIELINQSLQLQKETENETEADINTVLDTKGLNEYTNEIILGHCIEMIK